MDDFPARSPMPLSSHLFSLFVILFSLLMRCYVLFFFPSISLDFTYNGESCSNTALNRQARGSRRSILEVGLLMSR